MACREAIVVAEPLLSARRDPHGGETGHSVSGVVLGSRDWILLTWMAHFWVLKEWYLNLA